MNQAPENGHSMTDESNLVPQNDASAATPQNASPTPKSAPSSADISSPKSAPSSADTSSPKSAPSSADTSSPKSAPSSADTSSPKSEAALRRESKKLLAEARKLYKRAKKHLNDDQRKEVEESIHALTLALQDTSHSCDTALQQMRTVTQKRLMFARKSSFQEIVESLLFALAFALILRTFFVEPFKIPTRSMVPTLMEGDQLFVTKLSYGLRLPFIDKYVVWFSAPQRGDVIVFAFPREEAAAHLARTNSGCLQAESLADEKDYIKRIIGVEGDKIEIREQVVYVNDQPIPQQPFYERPVNDYMYLTDKRREFWNTERIGETRYTTITHELPSSQFGPITVAPGHVFCMGDNRDNSADSRCWGQVPVDNIKGRAQIIWWSSGHWSPRWERMFTWIH